MPEFTEAPNCYIDKAHIERKEWNQSWPPKGGICAYTSAVFTHGCDFLSPHRSPDFYRLWTSEIGLDIAAQQLARVHNQVYCLERSLPETEFTQRAALLEHIQAAWILIPGNNFHFLPGHVLGVSRINGRFQVWDTLDPPGVFLSDIQGIVARTLKYFHRDHTPIHLGIWLYLFNPKTQQ